jgi:hypothetical protein
MPKYDYFRKSAGGNAAYQIVGSQEFKNINQAAAFARKHKLKFLPHEETLARAGVTSDRPVQRVIKATKRPQQEWDIFSEVPVTAPPITKPCACTNQIIMYGVVAFALGWLVVPWLRKNYLPPTS